MNLALRFLSPLLLASTLVAGCATDPKVGLSPRSEQLLAQANAGNAEAQFALASAYDSGNGAPRNAAESMRWYRAAAEQGLPEAQNSVGSGLQAEKKYVEARDWYRKAADQDHALATNNLAYLYDLGLGVPQDRREAFRLYMRAAELGWAEAMWNVANMYGTGQLGGPPNLGLACVWTLRAGTFSTPDQSQLRSYVARTTQQLEHTLPSAEMQACRTQAEDWRPNKPVRKAVPQK